MKRLFSSNLPTDIWNHGPVLVGVSGGADSVALLHLLVSVSNQSLEVEKRTPSEVSSVPKIIAVHFDHQWRPESAGEAKWVKELAERFGVGFLEGKASEFSDPDLQSKGKGLEGLARSQRYEFFKWAMDQTGARYLLTAHHKNDQIETILMRILRGTSIEGLSGIPQKRRLKDGNWVLRPMLPFSRQDIESYTIENALEFLTDPSNGDTDRTRNRVRHKLVPELSELFGASCLEALNRLGENASEIQHVLESYESRFDDGVSFCSDGKGMEVLISSLPSDGVLIKRLLRRWWKKAGLPQREMTREHWQRLADLAIRPEPADRWPSRCHFPGPIFASRSKGVLTVGSSSETQ